MSNHFHLLCEVPQAQELSEAELLERIQAGYGPARRQALDQELAHLRQGPDGADQIQRLLKPYRDTMFDLSIFNKELNLRIQRPLCPMVQPPPWSLWGALGRSL